MNRIGRFVGVGAVCATACCGVGQVKYSLKDLGTLGGAESWAFGINGLGQVAGWSDTVGTSAPHAFLYSGGVMSDLGTMGGSESFGWGIDDYGRVVGSSSLTGDPSDPYGQVIEHAFLYSGGAMTDLGTLGGLHSRALGINDSGQVVGYAYTSSGAIHAFLYSGGVMSDLHQPQWFSSEAFAINNAGEIVGMAPLVPGWGFIDAFLYKPGIGVTDLSPLGNGTSIWAYAINSAGDVVGFGQTASFAVDAFIYSGGVMTDLGNMGGGECEPYGINDSGQIVGWYRTPQNSFRGFVYSGGTMNDLTGLLDSSGQGWVTTFIEAINNRGQIVGRAGGPAGQDDAVLLSPDAGAAGKVTLQDFAGDVTQVPLVVELRSPGSTVAVQSGLVALGSDGSFEFATTLKGTYDVAVKAPHWLRKTISSVTLTGTTFIGSLGFSLLNGDVNGDNTINLSDLLAVSAAWRATPGSSNWNANADLNGDGVVNLADWMIVAKNWRKSGDP